MGAGKGGVELGGEASCCLDGEEEILKKKPLGRKAYGSIPHLPGSRLGSGDHSITEGQAKICTFKCRPGDTVIVQDKLDGSNTAIAMLDDGRIVPLGRSGYLAETSPYLQHHLFSDWVYANHGRFQKLLNPGEWISGEWLAMTHGTPYLISEAPFVAFDLFHDGERICFEDLRERLGGSVNLPMVLHRGGAYSIEEAMDSKHYDGRYVPTTGREGAVWRVEREGRVDFLAKYVRHDKEDGKYLNSVTWNQGVKNYLPPKALKRMERDANPTP